MTEWRGLRRGNGDVWIGHVLLYESYKAREISDVQRMREKCSS